MNGLEGVDPQLAQWIRELRDYIEQHYPTVSIAVVSGYRSAAHQARLRAQWDAGIRTGLVVRPAERSSHSDGRAVDLQFTVAGYLVPVKATPVAAFRYLASILRPLGVIWGGSFRVADVNHFEIPLSA